MQTELINERIRAVFDAAFLARHAGAGDPDPAPIFVVGLPRSGSTLIEQILGSHSQVDATHELPEAGRLVRRIGRGRKDGLAYPEAARDFDGERWAALGRAYLDDTHKYRRGAPRFIDKMPNNFPTIGLLALALPNARFINARRHPLDTCLSCFRQLFARGQPFTYDLAELGEYYLEYEKMMAHWHAALPGRVLDVQYEDVVADQPGQARRLLEYCGLAVRGRMPAVLGNRARDPHGELRAGTTADLRDVGRRLAELRARARAVDRDPAADFAGVWPKHLTWSILEFRTAPRTRMS